MAKVLKDFKSISSSSKINFLWHPYMMAFYCGIFVGTSYIPFKGWALFFCYVPLWIANLKQIISESSYKKIFFTGWIAQFILTLIGFNWIYYTASEFGQLHWSLSLAALLLFATFMHLYIPLSIVIVTWISRRFKILSAFHIFILLALSLALLERIWPSIFEWNLGYVLFWLKWPMFQWADTVGFFGLSTIIFILQACIAYAVWMYKIRRRQSFLSLSGVVIFLLITNLVGHYKEEKWKKTDSLVNFGIAQGDVGNAEKIQSEQGSQYHSYILKLYTDLTQNLYQLAPQTEIMLWPETALPFPLDEGFQFGSSQKKMAEFLKETGRPVLTGAYSIDPTRRDLLGYNIIRNSFFYMGSDGKSLAPNYNKTNLLVFGEYMPFGEQFPILYKLLPFVGSYERGPGPTVQTIPLKDKKLSIGPQICYESLDPAFSRLLALRGADIIVNVTNDSWYGWWSEPYQHMMMTLARGVETRRPLIRATNTGISTAVLADGEILELSPIDQKWTHSFEVPYRKNAAQSFYTLVGSYDWILWLTLWILFIYVGAKTPPDISKIIDPTLDNKDK